MKGFLTRFGYGAAEFGIDPAVERVSPGDSVDVRIDVEGGAAAQNAESIFAKVSATTSLGDSIAQSQVRVPTKVSMELFAKAAGVKEDVDPALEYTIDVFEIDEGVTIESGERWTTTATLDVPHATPLTMGDIYVWLGGKMKVLVSRNPSSERHYIDVVPDERFEAVFEAVERMGMIYVGTKLTTEPSACTESNPFVSPNQYLEDDTYPFQLFRFYPEERPYADVIDVLDLQILGTEDGLEVDVELDALPDGKTTLEFEHTDVDTIRAELEAVIDRTR